MALHLGVESSVIDTVKGDNPGRSEEACREILNRWLNADPDTGVTERTWRSVLEALETSGHRQLAEQLRREELGEHSEGPVSELTSPPGMCACVHVCVCVCACADGLHDLKGLLLLGGVFPQ